MPTTISGTTGVSAVQDSTITPAKLTQPLTLSTAQNTTSGTSIDFTGIPSWVKRITVMLNGVSLNGTSSFLFQIGSGSIQTTGYVGAGLRYVNTTIAAGNTSNGFSPANTTAAAAYGGQLVFATLGSNIWTAVGNFGTASAAEMGCMCSGVVTLGGTLDRIRLTTVNGTDTFDAGSVNILYE